MELDCLKFLEVLTPFFKQCLETLGLTDSYEHRPLCHGGIGNVRALSSANCAVVTREVIWEVAMSRCLAFPDRPGSQWLILVQFIEMFLIFYPL